MFLYRLPDEPLPRRATDEHIIYLANEVLTAEDLDPVDDVFDAIDALHARGDVTVTEIPEEIGTDEDWDAALFPLVDAWL